VISQIIVLITPIILDDYTDFGLIAPVIRYYPNNWIAKLSRIAGIFKGRLSTRLKS
jgi:hypothetical protein